MKKLTTTVTYKVPDGIYCEQCRFCRPIKKAYVCALHNDPLLIESDSMVRKTKNCLIGKKSADQISTSDILDIYDQLIKSGVKFKKAKEIIIERYGG